MKDQEVVRQVIAIGGGGFGRSPQNPTIERYIVEQSPKDRPKILFIPTASAEDQRYVVNYYTCFSKLSCEPTHLSLFQRTPDLGSLLAKQDIIYVGGGNTKSMLAVWKDWQLDELLLKAYERGVILCGVSAGAICWFKKGITDSWANRLGVLDCLGFIPETACPHYDGEKDRRPSVHGMLENSEIENCFAIEDGAAAHFKNEVFDSVVSFMPEKTCYLVEKTDKKIKEKNLIS